MDHVALPREFYSPLSDISPGMVGMEACESPPTPRKTKGIIEERNLVRPSLGIQQFFGKGDLDTVNGLPRLEIPADGMTKVKSDILPLLRLLESGACHPSVLRPLQLVAPNERAKH